MQTDNIVNNSDIQLQIWNSVNKLDYNQQLKLLDFINSLFPKVDNKNSELLKFAGIIDKDELELIKDSIKDC